MMPIARLAGVTKAYRVGDTRVPALRDVDLAIAPGEFVALVGPSGSGKSTLFNVLGGLDRVDSGRVEVDGTDLAGLSRRALARLRLTRLGFVFQVFNLFPVLTVAENVEYPLIFAGLPRTTRRARVHELLASVGLTEHARKRPNALSGGQAQRVAIARALACRPVLVLADEPTANLDGDTSATVMGLLRDLNVRDGVTFLLATHDPRVLPYARRRVTLTDGRITDDRAQSSVPSQVA
jgi:putative ABC transport system ATP-binding protein